MEPTAGALALEEGEPGSVAGGQRVPLTVLAGFLGSGKTTLLNRILAGSHGLRITVFVNDFGAINVDSRLVVSRDATTITLENGCVCCSVTNDLVFQLAGALEGEEPPEHVLIEASGVSDPGRLLVALRDPHLRSLARIDGVITLLDVSTADEIPPAAHELVRRQLASADLIVFNKTDLVTADELEALRARLSYPRARIVEASFGDVPLEVVLGVASLAGGRGGDDDVATIPVTVAHEHADMFSTWSWVCDRPLSLRASRAVLASLPAGIYRAKGFLYLAEAPGQRAVAHVVGRRVDIRPHGAWGDQPPRSELVFISLEHVVDVESLRLRLEEAAAAAEPEPGITHSPVA